MNMTDPIERLRSFDPVGRTAPPDPAGVRRRGDRIRRRRQRVLMAAAVAAVAAVIVPVAVLRGDGGSLPAAPAAPTSAVPGPEAIPVDFPLAAGWPDESEPGPEFGLTPPRPDLEHPAFDYPACGRALPVPAGTDRLRALWTDVEDLRSRQLLTFPDAGAAAAFVAAAADFYRACGVEPAGTDGLTYTWTVVPTPYGGQSVAAGSTPSRDGGFAVGVVRTVHLTRLGSAVLVDTTEGEGGGGGGDLPGVTRSDADDMARAAAPVVAAMCRFTEAGC
jgi:hypothetical protein